MRRFLSYPDRSSGAHFATVARRAAALASAAMLAAPTAAQAQSARPLTGRLSGAVQLQVSEPRGDFAQNTGNGFGVNGSLIAAFDPQAIATWRLDAGFLTYGNERRRIPLAGTGGLVQLDLRTSNNIFTLVTGPQLQVPVGAFTPYVAALGGFSAFWTQSSVEGSRNDNEPFASTTNSSDAAFTYGGAVGAHIRLNNGPRAVRLDLGARFLRHDDARYLNDQRVREAFEQDRPTVPIRGRADFLTYFLGVNAVIF